MKESLHWNEEDLARQLRDAQEPPREEDWAAMESLLDRAGQDQPAAPYPAGIPGPAAGWHEPRAGWLLGGLLSGLLLLLLQAAWPSHWGQTSRETMAIPVRDLHDSRPGTSPDTGIPMGKTGSSDLMAIPQDSPKDAPAPVPAARRRDGQTTPPPPFPPEQAAAGAPAEMYAPLTTPPSSPEAVRERSGPRVETIPFDALPEEAYNIGLVAVSRLRKPLHRPESLAGPAFPEPPAAPMAPLPRWRFGVAGGLRIDTSPFDRTAPFTPWMGMQVRYDLGGAWFLQSGISAKWLDRKGYYGPAASEFEPNMTPGATVSLRKSQGLLIWELPILAGWQKGRWFATGGARLAAAMATGPQNEWSAEEVLSYRLQGDLAGSPNNPDLGLALGAGYFLHPALALELRYHHGLGVFLPASASGQTRDFRHRDLQLGLAWWPGR